MILNDVMKEWRPPCFYTETELRCMLNKVNTDSNVPPASCLDSFLGMFYTDRGIRSVAQQTWWRSNLPLSQQKQPMMENIPLKWSSCRSRRTPPPSPLVRTHDTFTFCQVSLRAPRHLPLQVEVIMDDAACTGRPSNHLNDTHTHKRTLKHPTVENIQSFGTVPAEARLTTLLWNAWLVNSSIN